MFENSRGELEGEAPAEPLATARMPSYLLEGEAPAEPNPMEGEAPAEPL